MFIEPFLQYEVFSTTQWMHMVQSFIASALDIQKNKIDVKVNTDSPRYASQLVPAKMMCRRRRRRKVTHAGKNSTVGAKSYHWKISLLLKNKRKGLIPLISCNFIWTFYFQVRRLGGGYGGKSTCSQLVSVACALAAHKVILFIRLNLFCF